MKTIIFTIFYFSILSVSTQAIGLDTFEEKINLSEHLEYFIDDEGIDDPLLLSPLIDKFKPPNNTAKALTLGRRKSPVWIRLLLKNPDSSTKAYYLAMNNLSIDYWDVYIPNEKNFTLFSYGDKHPNSHHLVNASSFTTRIILAPHEEITVYARVRTRGTIVLPLYLYTENHYQNIISRRSNYTNHFSGIIIGLFFFSLLIGLHTQEKIYIIYSSVLFMRWVQLLIIAGIFQKWASQFHLHSEHSLIFVQSLYNASGLLFHSHFMCLKEHNRKLDRIIYFVIFACLLYGLLIPLISITIAAFVSQLVVLLSTILVFYSAIKRFINGFKPAGIYLISIIFPVVAAAYAILMTNGFVDYNENITTIFGGSISISVVLFAFALSTRINIINDEKRIAESQALEAKIEAETRSNFLAQMSHEIRTPMNGVLGMSQILETTPLNDNQKKYNQIIKSSGNLLLQVINDVLDYSKIQAGKMAIEAVDFDPRALVNEIATIFEEKVKLKNIFFTVNIANDIPLLLKGDPTRIRQILFNLVNNAYKFTESGGITLSIVQVANSNNFRFSVEDTGIGIKESSVCKLFTPYYQTSNDISRKFGGTGLGLSICKSLSEAMGGQIGVESCYGKGSTFWFTLPLVSATQEHSSNPSQTSSENQTKFSDPSLNVLLAEDNEVNQMVAQGMLSSLGHTFTTVTNGKEAVLAVRANPSFFDLVLMDCEMPELDGLEATRLLRKDTKTTQIPVVALTAHAMEDQVKLCYEAGMNGYIAKPLQIDDLRRICRTYGPRNDNGKIRQLNG